MPERKCYYYDCFGGGPTIPILLVPTKPEDDNWLCVMLLAVGHLLKNTRFLTKFKRQQLGYTATIQTRP
jgi:hypothetical protein